MRTGRSGERILAWQDALAAYLLTIAGGLAFVYAYRVHLLSGIEVDYAFHLYLLAIPLAWFFVLRRRFPIGRFVHRQLRPWYVLWAILIVGELGAAFVSPPEHVQLPAPAVTIAHLLYLAALVGTAEEFLFRGLIQTAINNSLRGGISVRSWRLNWGTGIAALLFGCFHFIDLPIQSLGATIEQVISAVFIGFVIGVVYDRTGNLIGACILHNLIDLMDFAAPLLAYAVVHG